MAQKRSSVSSINQSLCAGLQKLYAGKSLVLAGKTWASADVITELQREATLGNAAAQAEAAWHKAVQQLQQQAQANVQLRQQLRVMLLQQLGNDHTALGDFGVTVQARRVPTPEVKAAAVQKRIATRTARHILGKRQRGAIVAPAQPASDGAAKGATTK